MTQHILIVEDNPDDGFLLSQIVGKLMHLDHMMVEDGGHALKAAARQDFSAVLLDLQLPDLQGWEIAAALRRLPQYRHIPIVAMTAYDRGSFRTLSKEAGCDIFLAKPIEIDKFIDVIRKCLKGT